nr:complement C1q and tumor necrosis factor-related protein 9B-like [Oncorhynchus nerka]
MMSGFSLSAVCVAVLFSLGRCQNGCLVQDGTPGAQGTPGRDGRQGAKGEKGEPGNREMEGVWLEPFKDEQPENVKEDKKDKKIVFNGFLLFPTGK